jgi:hypothetical protein
MDHRRPLDGVYAKLGRADLHGESLKAEIAAYLDERPFELVSEPDVTGERCQLRAKIAIEIPTVPWGVQLGEIIHDLRSSLDHLAWQLALAHRPGEHPPARTEFPIFISADRYDREAVPKLAGISPEAQSVIRQLQPFAVYEEPDRHPLWYLHGLSNLDKHRVVNVVAAVLRSVAFWEETVKELGIDPSLFAFVNTFDDGDILATWPIHPTCSAAADRVQFGFGVAFDPGGPARGWPVDNAIEHWSPYIRETIIPAVAPFLEPTRIDR